MERKFRIEKPNDDLRCRITEMIDNLNKPKGSLGFLEQLAEQICLIQQTLKPSLHRPCHLLFGGDHGIEREGVSVSPRDVTWQQMINFSHGGGGVNMFCRQHNFHLEIVDVGVDHDLSGVDGIRDMKIARGTENFLYHAAMSEEEFERAVNIGTMLVDEAIDKGTNIICVGEMGIGNTSGSSIWMSLIAKLPLIDCIGIGAGLDNDGLQHKRDILQQSVNRFLTANKEPTTEDILREFGGFEMIAAIGAMLRAAERKIIVMIDGFIMSACAMAAIRLYPESFDYMIFGHKGDESGHGRLLGIIGAHPILNLGMRLGEGTGALCAYPIIESAVRMVNEMNNFKDAKITKYF